MTSIELKFFASRTDGKEIYKADFGILKFNISASIDSLFTHNQLTTLAHSQSQPLELLNQPPSNLITMGNIISSIARGINAVLMAIVNVSPLSPTRSQQQPSMLSDAISFHFS